MMDEPLKTCPECKGEIHRLISASGIVFKGSGFHVTDYKKSSNPASTSQPAAVADQKSDKKEEIKPTTTETKSSKATASPNPSK